MREHSLSGLIQYMEKIEIAEAQALGRDVRYCSCLCLVSILTVDLGSAEGAVFG